MASPYVCGLPLLLAVDDDGRKGDVFSIPVTSEERGRRDRRGANRGIIRSTVVIVYGIVACNRIDQCRNLGDVPENSYYVCTISLPVVPQE